MKKVLVILLTVLLLCSGMIQSLAMSETEWSALWGTADITAGITMFPGSDESERNFTWYTEKENTPSVLLSTDKDMSTVTTFDGTTTAASEGDYANYVTISGLETETTYYYQCISGDFKSEIYSFTTAADAEFRAIYMTDIHITEDTEDEAELSKTAFNFNNTVEDAISRYDDISIVLSTGDQASEGLESEYKALTASPLLKSLTIATTIGNHDRKGIEYRTYTNVPNEYDDAKAVSYVGRDYWFVKGDALFLVADSCCGSGIDHAKFIKSALKANPDVKWKILMTHHDLYSGRIPHRESENALHRIIWGPICAEFGIDIMLLGHSHYYTVSHVLRNNKIVAPFEKQMTDPEGTLFMVSCSINRPRDDEEIGLNEEIGFDYLTDKPTYNILTFTEDSITVESFETGAEKSFNSFTITKTSQNGGHDTDVSFFRAIGNFFVRRIGRIYTYFNNIGVYSDLKEDGYNVKFFDVVFG